MGHVEKVQTIGVMPEIGEDERSFLPLEIV